MKRNHLYCGLLSVFAFVVGCKVSKIKVALLVDEYFGGAGTAFGGYGFLARNLIAKYLPDESIEVEVILRKQNKQLSPKCHMVDGIKVYTLASKLFDIVNYCFFKKKNYDLFLSIELTNPSYKVLNTLGNSHKKLLLWIQDPRPKSEWDEIETVKLFPEKTYWNQRVYDFINKKNKKNLVSFVSQARFLDEKAKELYQLPNTTPIQFLPNPIEIDQQFDVKTYPKKNSIIFLGRIESVKRGWLFCEIAKQLPEYEFYMLGQTFRQSSQNSSIMEQYQNISNLHFMGHVEGEQKNQLIRDAKILVNTSIHEALPISFLEALSYGTLLVSCRNPEDLTSKFGVFTGTVLGDGFDKVGLFVDGINKLMNDNELRQLLAEQAVQYIKDVHSIELFVKNLREQIKNEVIIK